MKATETFIACWGEIWRKALSIDLMNPFLSKASYIDSALRDIYNLRSDLARSDPTSLPLSLMRTKQSCGELFNHNQYDPSNAGITILMIVDEFLEFLSVNEVVFRDLLNGIKPT
jgi:hypothetical protein